MDIVRAKWILPVDGPAIEGGSVSIARGRIVAIGHSRRTPCTLDLGDAIVFPQWVNAHTHLEFSDCAQPLGASPQFADWIGLVIANRRQRIASLGSAGLSLAVRRGLQEARATTTAGLGEIRVAPYDRNDYLGHAPLSVVFQERLGLNPLLVPETIAELEALIRAELAHGGTPIGLSPHAPYSTHITLVQSMIELARRYQLPVAMHLAESHDEMELLESRRGPLRERLKSLRVWDDSCIPSGTTITDYVRMLSLAHRSLIVHGNYLGENDWDVIALNRNRMSVAYCPRTHALFGHRPYPLAELLRRKIEVSVATDSRATNPNLNLANDVRFAAGIFPQVSAETWLRMATIYPARAIGLDRDLGSLAMGKWGRLAMVRIASSAKGSPEEIWLEAIRANLPVERVPAGDIIPPTSAPTGNIESPAAPT